MRRCFAGIQPPSRLVLVLCRNVVGLVVAVVSLMVFVAEFIVKMVTAVSELLGTKPSFQLFLSFRLFPISAT